MPDAPANITTADAALVEAIAQIVAAAAVRRIQAKKNARLVDGKSPARAKGLCNEDHSKTTP